MSMICTKSAKLKILNMTFEDIDFIKTSIFPSTEEAPFLYIDIEITIPLKPEDKNISEKLIKYIRQAPLDTGIEFEIKQGRKKSKKYLMSCDSWGPGFLFGQLNEFSITGREIIQPPKFINKWVDGWLLVRDEDVHDLEPVECYCNCSHCCRCEEEYKKIKVGTQKWIYFLRNKKDFKTDYIGRYHNKWKAEDFEKEYAGGVPKGCEKPQAYRMILSIWENLDE